MSLLLQVLRYRDAYLGMQGGGQHVLPPLILQPLLENAIYYGIERLPGGGTIYVDGDCEGGRVTIVISNPVLPETAGEPHVGHRIAQENIRQRLQIIFGDSAELLSMLQAGVYKVVMHFFVMTKRRRVCALRRCWSP